MEAEMATANTVMDALRNEKEVSEREKVKGGRTWRSLIWRGAARCGALSSAYRL